jgi:hypothetical protein
MARAIPLQARRAMRLFPMRGQLRLQLVEGSARIPLARRGADFERRSEVFERVAGCDVRARRVALASVVGVMRLLERIGNGVTTEAPATAPTAAPMTAPIGPAAVPTTAPVAAPVTTAPATAANGCCGRPTTGSSEGALSARVVLSFIEVSLGWASNSESRLHARLRSVGMPGFGCEAVGIDRQPEVRSAGPTR